MVAESSEKLIFKICILHCGSLQSSEHIHLLLTLLKAYSVTARVTAMPTSRPPPSIPFSGLLLHQQAFHSTIQSIGSCTASVRMEPMQASVLSTMHDFLNQTMTDVMACCPLLMSYEYIHLGVSIPPRSPRRTWTLYIYCIPFSRHVTAYNLKRKGNSLTEELG